MLAALDNYTRLMASVIATHETGCRQCLRSGGRWVALRICLSCGHVGCCNDSAHQHAKDHAQATGHPLVERYVPSSGQLV